MDSEFSMRILESKYVRFENDEDPFCGVCITASDRHTTFTFDGLGLHRSHLRRIITEIDRTLAGKYDKDFHLQFNDPNLIGGEECFSPISFMIHCGQTHKEDYWEFLYESNGGYHNSGKTRC